MMPPLMKKRLKRIDPVQLGLVLGVTYALVSLLAVLFFLMFGMVVHNIADGEGSLGPGAGLITLLTGVGAFVFPIINGVAGLIVGLVTAVFYNLAARWTGGIEVTVEDIA